MAAGFTGDTCLVNIDDCLSQPCLNDAACEDAVNGYVCHCLKGKSVLPLSSLLLPFLPCLITAASVK